MDLIAQILVKYRVRFLVVSLGLLVACAMFFSFPQLTGSLSGFELENNWHFEQYKKTDSLFGHQQKIYLHVTPKNDNRNQTFGGVAHLSKNISKSYPESSIISPVSFYVGMKDHWKSKDSSLVSFFSEAESIPILNQLIAKDKKSFLIVVTTKNSKDIKVSEFDKLIHVPLDGIESVKAISPMHIEDSIARYITLDVRNIIILILLFFFLYIMLVFKNLYAVLFTLGIMVVSIIATLYLFSVFGYSMNLISILAIPIVLILSLSDALHLLSSYVKYNYIGEKKERLKTVISHVIIPSVFSSATTSAAFLSFYFFNESPFIKEFGLITSIAIMLEVVITFSVAPFLLFKFNITKVYDRQIIGLSTLLIRIRKPISIALLAIMVIAIFLANQLEFKSSNEIFFPTNSEIEETHDALRENFASNLALDVFVQLEETHFKNETEKEIAEKELLNYTRLLTNKFKKEELIVHVNSATNNYFFKSRMGVPINLYKVLGSKNPYHNEETGAYHIELKLASADNIIAFQKTELDQLSANVPENIEVTYSSLAILTDEINKSVSSSLIKSLSSSGIVIFLMILILTRSIKTSLFSLAPNIVPLAFLIIIFYVFNIHLNIITAITGVICLGLLDDDTVHILYRKLWLKEPMGELSFSILSSAILLIGGFSFFLVSSFEPIRVLGWVSALIFFIGIISEMTIMHWILEDDKKGKKL